MSLPTVLEVLPGTPAELAGLQPGDELVSINGVVPNDVIEYQQLVDDTDPVFTLVAPRGLRSIEARTNGSVA